MKALQGVGVALVTPMHADGSIAWAAYERLLDYTHQIGVDYWVVQGTTGESPTITAEEKKRLLDLAKAHPAQKPIVFGIGGNNTQAVVRQLKEIDLSGVSAILSVCPYYNKPSQEGLYRHFIEVAEHSPVPVILYNVPGRTGCNLQAATTLRLAQHPNIVAIKEASGDLMQIMQIAAERPEGFLLLSGDDLLTPAMVAIGAEGVISVMANAFASFNDMVHACLAGEKENVKQLLKQLIGINELLYKEGNPVGIKCVLKHMGICEEHVRLPLAPASAALSKAIEDALKKLSLLPQ